jgi:transposase
MMRLRGRGPRGERVIGLVPQGRWKTITLVADLSHNRMVAPLIVDGAMNGATFLAYIEQCLAPTLEPGDIVIMDNSAAHKFAGIAEAIEAVGATMFYLPQYSPDLNPIEQAFSKIKALLRKTAECTVPRLCLRIAKLLASVSAKKCANFFHHAGYAST